MSATPRALAAVLAALLLAVAVAAAQAAEGEEPAPGEEPAVAPDPNPCLGEERRALRCPDLVMKPPSSIWVDRGTRRGRLLLRSTNSIDNVGRGPASLRGRRDGRKTMDARQVIQRTNGRRKLVRTGARLYFQPIPGQYRYWKFADAARFQLWSVDRKLRRRRLVRVGPKQNYCLRDLRRTRDIRFSPRSQVFPACSQDAGRRAVTLGTSVGWSDIYPSTYHQNWIDVTGLRRGRYAYVHIADPKNGIWELDEENNESQVIVWLPSGKVVGRGRMERSPDSGSGY